MKIPAYRNTLTQTDATELARTIKALAPDECIVRVCKHPHAEQFAVEISLDEFEWQIVTDYNVWNKVVRPAFVAQIKKLGADRIKSRRAYVRRVRKTQHAH